MKVRNTIIFGIILILLLGYVYFFEVKKAEEEAQKEEATKQVFLLDWDQAEELSLRNGERMIVCKKEVQGETEGVEALWEIVEPLQVLAEQSSVRGIINGLKGLEVERVVEESPADVSRYGLEGPEKEITVKLREGTEVHTLFLGKENPIGNTIYVRKEGDDRVLLVKKGVEGHVEKDLFDLREKKLLKLSRADVDRISLREKSSEIVLLKGEGGEWRATSPGSFRAAKSEVNKVLSALVNLKAAAFEDKPAEDLSAYGLDYPRKEVGVREGESTLELLIGKDAEGAEQTWVQSVQGDVIARVSSTSLKDIDVMPVDLREKKLFRMSRYQVGAVKVRRGEEELIFEKDGNDWNVVQPQAGKAKPGMVDELLAKVTELKIEKFADKGEPGDYGIDDVSMEIILVKKDKEEEDSLKVGGKEEGEEENKVWIQSSYLEAVGLVDGAFREKIPENFQDVLIEEPVSENGSTEEEAADEP